MALTSGVTTSNISNRPALADHVLVNRAGSTGLQKVDDLARQIAGSGPLAVAITGAAAGLVRAASLSDLNAIAGAREGQPGEVTEGPDKGAYAWSGTTWDRVGDIIDQAMVEETAAGVVETNTRLTQEFVLRVVESSLMIAAPLATGRTLANGAVAQGNGWKIPNGATGAGTVVNAEGSYYQKLLAGQRYLLFFKALTSANFSTQLAMAPATFVAFSGTAGVVLSAQAFGVTDVDRYVAIEYLASGAEGYCGLRELVSGSQPAVSADVTYEIVAQGYVALDSGAQNQILTRSLTEAVALSASEGNLDYPTTYMTNGSVSDGAVFFDGEAVSGSSSAGGWQIPAGQRGQNSYMNAQFYVLGALTAGHRYRFTADVVTSNNFDGNMLPLSLGVVDFLGTLGDVSNLLAVRPYGSLTRRIVSFDLVASGSEGLLAVREIVNAAQTAVSFDVTYYIDNLSYRSLEPDAQREIVQRLIDDTVGVSAPRQISYSKSITVGPVGRSYTDLEAAIAAEGGGDTYYSRVAYIVDPGIYQTNPANNTVDYNLFVPDFVDIIANGPPGSVIWQRLLPDDTAKAVIETAEVCWISGSNRTFGVHFRVQNGRYACHCDQNLSPYQHTQFFDCTFEHLGNDGARAHHGDPTIWESEWPLGLGTNSGQRIETINCRHISKRGAVYMHDNTNFADGSAYIIRGGEIACDDYRRAIFLAPLYSGRMSEMLIDGARVEGGVFVYGGTQDQPPEDNWSWTALCIKLTLTNVGYSIPVLSYNRAADNPVLSLRSIATAGSKVEISGPLFARLFGPTPYAQNGGTNYAGRVLSLYGMSTTATTLAAKLGNLTGAPLSGTVIFDGGSPITVTANANYTGMSNADVIAALNVILHAAAGDSLRSFVADTEYFELLANVSQPEWEDFAVSTEANLVIPRGAPVKRVGLFGIRLYLSSDTGPADGIAKQPIAPGERGIYHKRGARLYQAQTTLGTGGTYAIGDTFGVSPVTPGLLVPTGYVLECVDVWHDGAVLVIS